MASKYRRPLGFTLLLSLAPAIVAGCGGDDTVSPGDGGADATVEGGLGEASCAVDAGPLDDAAIQLGEAIITAHKCFQCHGGALSGNNDGVYFPEDEGGFAYPPNLTSDPAAGLGCWTNEQIANAILNGVDNEGMPLCPPMPRFGHLADGGLDAAEVQAVIAYLRSLPVSANQVPNTECTVSDGGPPGEGGLADAGPDSPIDASPSDATLEDAPHGGDAATDAGDAMADGGDAAVDGSSAMADASDATVDGVAAMADAGDATADGVAATADGGDATVEAGDASGDEAGEGGD